MMPSRWFSVYLWQGQSISDLKCNLAMCSNHQDTFAILDSKGLDEIMWLIAFWDVLEYKHGKQCTTCCKSHYPFSARMGPTTSHYLLLLQ